MIACEELPFNTLTSQLLLMKKSGLTGCVQDNIYRMHWGGGQITLAMWYWHNYLSSQDIHKMDENVDAVKWGERCIRMIGWLKLSVSKMSKKKNIL